ncbi:hypothetical protein GGF32_008295 [Allomyces javanicus]|nr:hypothetical protein GGF32_008295 [Allomyces javanicus]
MCFSLFLRVVIPNLWIKTPSANGRVNVGRCLDFAPETANRNYAKAALWTCHAPSDAFADHQLFDVWYYEQPHTDEHGTWYDMTISREHNGVRYCLDLWQGMVFEGARVQFWKCTGGEPQSWSYNFATAQIRYGTHSDMCVAVLESAVSNNNGQEVSLSGCFYYAPSSPTAQFEILARGVAVSNGLPELDSRCASRGQRCHFDCPDLWTVGEQAEAWIDGTRLACGRMSSNKLYCITAAPSVGSINSNAWCGCYCPQGDPGHHGFSPLRFPVPQLRVTPDMPVSVRPVEGNTPV